MQQGLVISDLHLFSRRSRAEELLAGIKGQIIEADLLVLNGDLFDFRWSNLPDMRATIEASLAWVAISSITGTSRTAGWMGKATGASVNHGAATSSAARSAGRFTMWRIPWGSPGKFMTFGFRSQPRFAGWRITSIGSCRDGGRKPTTATSAIPTSPSPDTATKG